jgi:hypothetical protein
MEMSSKILKKGILHSEIPVSYKQRKMGVSKISGNFKNSLKAAVVMILTYLKILFL